MNKFIRTLTIYYDTELAQQEVPLFRGAVLKSLGEKANILFHNHTGENTFRYAYPMIQYKRINGKAAIVCIEDGVDQIGRFLSNNDGVFVIGERQVNYKVIRIQPARLLVQTWESVFNYHITRWLPLNSLNYQKYLEIEGMIEKISFLENILKANLLSMLKGLGIHIENEVILKLTELSDPYLINNKGVKLMSFNASFNCNLSIPNNIGIGKNASIGYGTVYQKQRIQENKETIK